MSVNRLPAPAGRLVDRSRTITFSFEGRTFEGLAGDTIASALAANGEWLLSRSFKYHRPRGILTMAGQDANTLVQIGDEPNVLADRREIEQDLVHVEAADVAEQHLLLAVLGIRHLEQGLVAAHEPEVRNRGLDHQLRE